MKYRKASAQFDAFLLDVAEESGLATTNQAYTAVDGVLRAFRERLTAEQGVIFAQTLPPLLASLFLADWTPGQAVKTDWERSSMTTEVQSLRRHHNFAPSSAIRDVAAVLRRQVDEPLFDAALHMLPPEARDFWNPALDNQR